MAQKSISIAVITCYKYPDYVRARTLRSALQTLPGVRVTVIKNSHTNWLRYPEVLKQVWQLRRQRFDAYLLTFRGQEILPFILAFAGRTPVWFDEFIVPIAYATGEKHRRSPGIVLKHTLARLSAPFYRHWLNRCAVILADTQAHAELSAKLNRINLSRYKAIPVGADETIFKPAVKADPAEPFEVFYYSTGMQPLHGLPIVLDAAVALQNAGVEFVIAGGQKPLQTAVKRAQQQGAKIIYQRWIPFDELVKTMHQASICLGGPFGGTPQAEHVITGKTYQMLAAGVPVVVGASPATNEFFNDKINALVVDQANPVALVKALTWAQAHPKELRHIAHNGRLLYERSFSVQAISKLLAPLVERL